MGKLIFQQFLSLDGYAADRNNSTDFFGTTEIAEGSDEDLLREMSRFETILLGANTYRMFVDFWPQATTDEQIVADKLNSIPKVVFSKSLKEAPWGKWEPAKVVSKDAVKYIQEMKESTSGDMVLWGSISLAQDIMKHNLIDEYHFRIVPVILGEGRLLFTKSSELKLKLIYSKTYASGLLLAQYQPV